MNRCLFILAFASVMHTSAALADDSFECTAEKRGITYTVKLWGAADHRSMSVSDSTGATASGRATAYRWNTRFFLPGESDTGFKLGIDGSSASLCFENGGRDCYPCTPIASRRERYSLSRSCVTETPRGRFAAKLFFTGEPTAEMVIENWTGEIASGPARMWVRSENVAYLQIGPTEGYYYYMDSGYLCDIGDPSACYSCESADSADGPAPLTLPETIFAECDYLGIEVTLAEQAGDIFFTVYYNQREAGTGDEQGWYVGPATNLGNDRWLFMDYRLSLFGTVGELCTPWDGCGSCTVVRPRRY